MEKKKTKPAPRAWKLPPEPPNPKKILFRQEAAKYARAHPEQFPEAARPGKAAVELYRSLYDDYRRKAVAKPPWNLAGRMGRIPFADLAPIVPDDAFQARIDKYYDTLPQHLRLRCPAGWNEFVVSSYLSGEPDGDPEHLYAKIDPDAEREPDGRLRRRVVLAPCTRERDGTYVPSMLLVLDAHTAPDEDGSDLSDSFTIKTSLCVDFTHFMTCVPPDELGWTDAELRLWEELALPCAMAGSRLSMEPGSATSVISGYAEAMKIMAYLMSVSPPPVPEESALARKTARPKWLKPDPEEDRRTQWVAGVLMVKSEDPPRPDPDLPKAGPERAGPAGGSSSEAPEPDADPDRGDEA